MADAKVPKASALLYVEEFKLEPGNVVGGNSVSGTVKLNGKAPIGGIVVNLSSNKSAATVPSNVTIPAEATSATFAISTSSVTSDATVTLTAKLGDNWKDALLVVSRAGVREVTVSPGSIMLGQTATGTVTLTGPAPGGNVSVKMTAGDKLNVPGLVWVSAGSTTATFPITTRIGPDSATYAISAELNGTQKSAVLKIEPTQLAAVQVSPTSVAGGTAVKGILTLGAFAPTEGVSVQISSNSSNAPFSGDVKTPSNSTTNSFMIQTYAGSTPVTATITARYRQVTKTAALKIEAATLTDFTASSTTVKYGPTSYVTLEVKISGIACVEGVRVPITTSNSNVINGGDLIVKHNYTTSPSASLRVFYVGKPTVVTLTATLNGLSKSINITVNP